MPRIFTSVDQLVGETPLFEPQNLAKKYSLKGKLFVKLEYLNPAGSVKDRAALQMINDAERRGALKPDSVIIEPTSGNTGIGLASIAASRGYRIIIVMPDSMSVERRTLMKAYGAELVLTEGAGGMTAAIKKAEELAAEIPNSFIPGQFVNHANAEAHFLTTGPEIWRDCGGKIDYFIAGVGTGGTITGVGEYLKSRDPKATIVAVEPATSAVLSGKPAGKHGLQGIGAGFIPKVLKREIIDLIMPVTDAEAFEAAREMGRHEGILVGISSGAALSAGIKLASKPENEGKSIVALLPDTGDRYLSTALFADQ